MKLVLSEDPDAPRRRRRTGADIKRALRELNNQVALLNHQVGSRVDLRPVDLDCLDVITLHGPLSPSELARRAGLHPATITGILDRLEKNRWVVRERADGDRRAVRVRALPDRARELFVLYGGMNDSMDDIFEDYSEEQLATLADFLQRASTAGFDATTALAEA
jgi:DNA-binding MarR family transcriptional regulator